MSDDTITSSANEGTRAVLRKHHAETEERVLRAIDTVLAYRGSSLQIDERWAAIAKTDIQRGFMALERAIAAPRLRASLPEDEPSAEPVNEAESAAAQEGA